MTIKTAMACKDVKTFLSKYQDNELDPGVRANIDAHLQACESCQKELLLLEEVTLRVKQLPEVETGPYFTARVMGKVMEKEKEKSPWLAWLPLPSSPSLSRLVYSFVFIIFLVLGVLANSSSYTSISPLNGDNRKSQQQELYMVKLLVESQDLSLINVQDKTFALLVNGNGETHEE
ncbi:MAG: zf-HC2 domain-containing protein [Candidatus Aminicenantes bacterium]|nr:MAG: zf-HC2 domain-containing protein [Candidatus Aminicenantes bacterium]